MKPQRAPGPSSCPTQPTGGGEEVENPELEKASGETFGRGPPSDLQEAFEHVAGAIECSRPMLEFLGENLENGVRVHNAWYNYIRKCGGLPSQAQWDNSNSASDSCVENFLRGVKSGRTWSPPRDEFEDDGESENRADDSPQDGRGGGSPARTGPGRRTKTA